MPNDTIYGTPQDNRFSSFAKVSARAGDDSILLTSIGVEPDDGVILLRGQAGADTIEVGDYTDVDATFLYGGTGDDVIRSVGGFLSGGLGGDELRNRRDDSGIPNATMRGGAGQDFLRLDATAGMGIDVLRGGDDADSFLFSVAIGAGRARISGGADDDRDIFAGRGRGTIVDFDPGHDLIWLDPELNGGPQRVRQRLAGTEDDPVLIVRYVDPGSFDDQPTILRLLALDAKLSGDVFFGFG